MIAKLSLEGDAPPSPPAAAAPAGHGEAGQTRESSLRWNTAQVPDGTYLIKIVASDRATNPSEPLTAEVISDPVMVANQPPHLVSFTHAVKTGADHKALVAGVAEAKIPIQGGEYRIDGGDWTALVPSDGIWDGRFEPWSLTTAALSSGPHQLEVKLVDAAGNIMKQTVKIEVP
jgi:hypothetical protein